jgi:hypothetical protein
MCTYLQLHQGTCSIGSGVLAELQHLFSTTSGKPRTTWQWSLGVKNREEAKRLLPEYISKTKAYIDKAKQAIAAAEREAARGPTDRQLAASPATTART